MKELLMKSDLLVKVVNNEKTVTSRLSSDLRVNDVVYVTDSNKDDYCSSLDIFFNIVSVERKQIKDVDYVQESMTSTQELIDVLNEIYYKNLKRVDREFTENDLMTVVTFEKVITRR